MSDYSTYLIVTLLQSYEWFDHSLQSSLKAAGWEDLTNPESVIVTHIAAGIKRPSDIARSLRISRQAVHSTVSSLVDRDVLQMVQDPEDKRMKIIEMTEKGEAMRRDARYVVHNLASVLESRIGTSNLKALRKALSAPWGDPVTIPIDKVAQDKLLAELK